MTASYVQEFIATVNLREVCNGSSWPIMRVLAPHFIEEIELGRYMRRLLATHRWSLVRVVPHTEAGTLRSKHVVDVWGVVCDADAHRLSTSAMRG